MIYKVEPKNTCRYSI